MTILSTASYSILARSWTTCQSTNLGGAGARCGLTSSIATGSSGRRTALPQRVGVLPAPVWGRPTTSMMTTTAMDVARTRMATVGSGGMAIAGTS